MKPSPFQTHGPHIHAPTDASRAYITGRNGTYEITAIHISELDNGIVMIDGIGKRGAVINGGLGINKEAWETICTEIVKRRIGNL